MQQPPVAKVWSADPLRTVNAKKVSKMSPRTPARWGRKLALSFALLASPKFGVPADFASETFQRFNHLKQSRELYSAAEIAIAPSVASATLARWARFNHHMRTPVIANRSGRKPAKNTSTRQTRPSPLP